MKTSLIKIGEVYGSLRVLDKPKTPIDSYKPWLCVCLICNKIDWYSSESIHPNRKYRCICAFHLKLGKHKYGSSWKGMIQRCYNPKEDSYINYGARGIRVCDFWKDPVYSHGLFRFLQWVEQQPGWDGEERLDVDRIDNDGPYSPENCQLIPRSINCRFTRRNRFIFMNGEKIHAIDVGRKLHGLNEHQVNVRISRKWHVFDAVNTPCDSKIAKLEGIFYNLRQGVKRYPEIPKRFKKEFNTEVQEYSEKLCDFYDNLERISATT